MALFEITKESLVQVPETRFDSKTLKSQDLQRLLRRDISVLAADLKVIAQDYGDSEEGGRRVDLLCMDKEANLVVVEIKRTAESSQVDLLAIRYAAMVSAMTFDDAVAAAVRDRSAEQVSMQDVRTDLLDFLDWTSPEDSQFGCAVRIILASADFPRDLTRSVIWLNDQGLDIRCVRLRPHRLSDGRVLLDVEQIVPLPEAGPYQESLKRQSHLLKLRASDQAQRRARFLNELWQTALKITHLHDNHRPVVQQASIAIRVRPGISFSYTTHKADSRVEFRIDSSERTQRTFDFIQGLRADIEKAYGRALRWRAYRERKSLRIQEVIEGGFLSPDESWPAIQEKMIDAMIRLEKTFYAYLDRVQQ